MKKFITMIVCLAITGGAFAKGIDIPKFTLGAKVGLNVSHITGEYMRDFGAKSKAGFHVGLAGEIKASRIFAIAPEILFSTQGNMIKQTEGGETIKISLNSGYINIPIMARFYIIDALSIEAGPQFGFATGMRQKIKVGDEKASSKVDSHKKFDFAIGVGATYNLNHKFFASVRYNFGLTNVLEENDIFASNKNGVFQLSVGYNFFRL